MKMLSWTLCLLFFKFAIGQQKENYEVDSLGIKWVKVMNWKQVCDMAQLQKKNIFLDCYTTWCAPCKYMDKEIYSLNEVGKLYNERFICVKLQMDRTANDNEFVRNWYSDAETLKRDYSVNAYPTYLFFSSNGMPLHKAVGAMSKDAIITLSDNAVDSNKQYYSLLKNFRPGVIDTTELRGLALAFRILDKNLSCKMAIDYLTRISLSAYSRKENIEIIRYFLKDSLVAQIVNSYLASLKPSDLHEYGNLELVKMLKIHEEAKKLAGSYVSSLSKSEKLKKDNIDLIRLFTDNSKSTFFKFIYQNVHVINNVMNDTFYSQRLIMNCIMKDYVIPEYDAINKTGDSTPNWNKVSEIISEKFNSYYSSLTIERAKAAWYFKKKMWPLCTKSFIKWMRVSGQITNDNIWIIFERSVDSSELKIALSWMKSLIKIDPYEHTWLDTYANLLYKLGAKEEALVWEERAVKLAPNDKDVKESLQRMKSNEPTWPTMDKNE